MKRGERVAPGDLEIARRFARALTERFGSSAFQITLFGSRARGDADEESDLDLFVAVDREGQVGEIKGAARQIACDLTIEYGILVSVFVGGRELLQRRREYSFFEAVRQEGMRL